jgi:hypothetical protein
MSGAIMVTESTRRQASTSRPWYSPPWYSQGGLALRATAILLLTLLLVIPFGRAARADDPRGIFIYAISRDGAPIGQQRMEFVSDGEKLRVLSHTELEVTLLGMSLYGFNQQVEEVRSAGKIVSLTSEADDDGTDRKVNLNLQGDMLKGAYNDNDRIIDPKLITSLFWQKPQTGETQLIDTLRGKVKDVNVKDLGPETLTLAVGRIEAHHYQMTGEWKRDLWYDANGILVAGELEKDGAKIRQELQQRP